MGDSGMVHNNFFAKLFKDEKNVADFISEALPVNIVKRFDLKSVKINDSSYIDENLKNHLSDLVIKLNTKNGKKTDVYILFEHKSYISENIIWQLLRYQYMMFEEDYRTERKFRIILPVVFYHGKRKWKLERSFGELTKVPEELKRYAMNFEYMLYDTKDFDLSQEEKFGKNAYLMSAMSLMKNIHRNDPEHFLHLVKYLKKTGILKKEDEVIIFLRYYFRTNDVEEKKIYDIMKNELGDKTEEIMPTLAQRWEERGRQEGIQKGRQEGMQKGMQKGVQKGIMQACKKALRCKIPVETVSSITGLSVKKVLEIKKELSESEEEK